MSAPEVRPVVRALDQAMIDRYADASGDHNPIHVDLEFARSTPMGGTIAHGMLVLAFMSEMMTACFGPAWLSTGTLDVRFRAPARPGDTVTARARAAESKEEGRLRYAVECVNQSDEVLISGTAEVSPEASRG
jgi:3-hydroxybutyryl-CoA dehydratase